MASIQMVAVLDSTHTVCAVELHTVCAVESRTAIQLVASLTDHNTAVGLDQKDVRS